MNKKDVIDCTKAAQAQIHYLQVMDKYNEDKNGN